MIPGGGGIGDGAGYNTWYQGLERGLSACKASALPSQLIALVPHHFWKMTYKIT